MNQQIVLASESPYRKELLERLGLSFITSPAHIDEDSYKSKHSDMLELTQVLAEQKAKEVLRKYPDSLVIGSDQAIGLEGKIFSKPQTFEKACQQLRELSGKAHELITAVCLMDKNGSEVFYNITVLRVRDLSDQDIEDYVKFDRPLNCAGSYKIEGRGITLFEKIEMDDFTSIIGLPLIQLTTALKNRKLL